MSDEIKEECGVFGAFGVPKAAYISYLGIYALQHRGQESAGVTSCHDGELFSYKRMGLVSQVFKRFKFSKLPGDIAIGHNRYSTTGHTSLANAQPLCMDCRLGSVAIAHNGNLVNADDVRHHLQENGAIFQTSSDSEAIVHLMSRAKSGDLVGAVKEALEQVMGAYCLLVLSPEKLIVARDPNGFRPLVLGELNGGWVVSSETCAFDLVGAKYVREVEPGEILVITRDGIESHFQKNIGKRRQCVFEYIYFSRPDSVIFSENCDKIRREMGRQLAREANVPDADHVISVPDSSNTAALGFSEESQIHFEIGLIRNHYVGRTFIKPDQSSRSFSVRLKFNPVQGVLSGKKIVLVDDSLVRGTTLKEIIQIIKGAGAAEVHVRVASPPIIGPCFFGIDLSSKDELIANNKTIEEIRDYIGADSLSYLSLEGMLGVVPGGKDCFCAGCFMDEYVMEPSKGYSKHRMKGTETHIF